MRKIGLKKFLTMLILGIGILFLPKIVNASSFSVTAAQTTLNPGGSTTVTVSTDCIGRFNISCSNGSVSQTKLWLEGSSASFTVTAGQSGTTTVSISPTNPLSTSNGQKVNLDAKSISFSINSSSGGGSSGGSSNGGSSSSSASNNANLSNLGLRTYDFTGFRAAITSYNVTVPNNVTSVQVYASVQASGAKYSVSGNTNLQVGTNPVKVTVTAPDGKTKKTYTIYVERQANTNSENVIPNVIEEKPEEQTEENKEEEQKEKLGLLGIAIDDNYEIYLEPEFKSDIYEYVINLTEDINSIPLTAIANQENAEVIISGNENLVDGENIITIEVKDKETEETVLYTIRVNKMMAEQEETKEEEKQEENKILQFLKDNWTILAIVGAFMVVTIITVIGVTIKIKHNREDRMFFEDTEEIKEDYFSENNPMKRNGKGKHF